MKKSVKKGLIISAIVAVIVGIIYLAIPKNDHPVNADSIIEASEETGMIGEKIVGNPDEAVLIIYEYADFGCSHCAEWNKKINDLLKEYDGKIALIFRSYNLGFKNSALSARAATAAQIQGYFKEYKDLLFTNQAEWYYEEGAKLNELFVNYFKEASNNKGDVNKFQEDMKSDAVKKRLKFEQRLGKAVNLAGTPTFRINGEAVALSDLINTIERLVNKNGG
jgi:protein-disulfide isomerase